MGCSGFVLFGGGVPGRRGPGLRGTIFGLKDESVSGRGVDQRIVSFLQIGHLKTAFFVHYL